MQLKEYFDSKASARRRGIFVVHGLGGMGKTWLAADFARTYRAEYSAVFWLERFSEVRLKRSVVNAARRLPRHEVTVSFLEGLQSPNIDSDQAVKGLLGWLKLPTNHNWLLIIDNVDRDYHSESRDPQAFYLKHYLPSADHGSILITSRLPSLARYGESKKLAGLDDEQAKVVLKNAAGKEAAGRLNNGGSR